MVIDEMPANEPQLLGLSFLSRFELKLDSRTHALTLTPHQTLARAR